MLKASFIILFSLCLISAAGAQDIQQLKIFADTQFHAKEYESALKEYQRVIFFDEEDAYEELYARIASIYFLRNEFDEAIRYYNLALRVEENDSTRYEFTFQKALCNFKTGDYLAALNELLDLRDPSSAYLSKKKDLYLGICFFGLEEYDSSRDYFTGMLDSAAVNELNSLFIEFERYKKKYRPEKVELMSMFLPGLGQIYTGQVFNGLNSFLLISGVTVYAVITAINYALLDGLLVMSSWFYRYYSGGFTNAGHFAAEKIEQEKARIYTEILSLIASNSIIPKNETL